jgi:hypothetical protein
VARPPAPDPTTRTSQVTIFVGVMAFLASHTGWSNAPGDL